MPMPPSSMLWCHMTDEQLAILLAIKDDVGQVKSRTECLPALTSRVTALEKGQSRIKGYGAGLVAAGSALAGYLKLHHS